MFGSPETTPGGRALKFYSSVRLDIRRVETIKDGAEMIGNRTRVKVAKNKVAPPFKLAEFDIMYGKGISREGSLLDVAVDLGIVKKSGAWFTYEGEQIGQGRENVKQFLTDNVDIVFEIMAKVKAEIGLVDDVDLAAEVEPVPEPEPTEATEEPAPTTTRRKSNGRSSAKAKDDAELGREPEPELESSSPSTPAPTAGDGGPSGPPSLACALRSPPALSRSRRRRPRARGLPGEPIRRPRGRGGDGSSTHR